MNRALTLFLVLLLGSSALAKELYLTVRRDFGPGEDPEVEVNYTQKTPLTFRLWKPKDMKEFVASQIDLRRAWRQPQVELNSAKYLFSGLNNTRLDLDWLRVATNREMRDKLKDKFGGATWTPPATRLSEGPKKMIQGPDKFELVKEFALYPDANDARTPFDVPGFDWWFQAYGGLSSKPIRLPRVDPGFYLVQVIQGNLEGQVVLAVNDISAVLQQTDGAAIVRVAQRSGAPIAGAAIEVRNLAGEWVANVKTDAEGVAELKGLKDTELVAVVRHGASTALIDTDFYSTTAVFPDLYLYTDRPMYKSRNKVRFKGVLREQNSGVSRLLASAARKQAAVSLVDLSGDVVAQEIQVPVSPFGTFSGELSLGDEDRNGVYRVSARVVDTTHVGEFRVKDYVKPLFFLKVSTAQETLKAGGKLQATVSVQRFAGGVPQGVRYNAQLFRVRAESPQWVEDAGLGESGSQTTYGWDGAKQVDAPGIPYPIANRDDIAFDGSGKSSLTLDIPPQLPGPPNFDYQFVLKLFARDPDGNNASASKTFLDLKSEVMAQARMSGVYASTDRPAKLSVRAVHPSGKPYGVTKGNLRWIHTAYKQEPTSRDESFTTDAQGRFDADVPADKPGKLDVVVTLYDRFDKPATTEATILVAGQPGEPIADVPELTLLTRRNVYAPGEEAKALVLLPEAWGEKGGDSGRLHITIAGRRIYEHRVQKVKGLSAWISQRMLESYGTAVYAVVAYSDPFRGWVERTLTFQIPPKNKALNVQVSPLNPLAKPGQQQSVTVKVSDGQGKPVEAELSVSVVDKALLTLQPEFRPGLLAFFYPLERLNLMSFFSTQFQGYGYGEMLAKRFRPNWWLASTKPESKIMKEEDTAHWSGQVLTDAKGLAKVSFRLPANQTTWNVSAVAVDTQGRFGEGTGEFVSSMPVMLSLSYPTFLRKNDSAQVRLILASQDPKKTHGVKAGLLPVPALTFERPLDLKTSLKPKQEAYGRAVVKLASLDAGELQLKTALDLEDEKLQFEYPMRTLANTVQFDEHHKLKGDGSVTPALEPKETLKEAKVFVATGFAGTLLPAMKWLMGYPFGCAEQLTSSTVPSLFVREILESESAPPPEPGKQDGLMERMKRRFFRMVASVKARYFGIQLAPEQQELLKSALEFSQSGLQRLKNYQSPDGSITWWPGGGEGNVPMTALVMMTLLSLDRTYEGIDYRRALGWLKDQSPMMNSSLGITVSYIESRLEVLGLVSGSGPALEASLKFQGQWAVNQGTLYDQALLALAIKYLKMDKRPGVDLVVQNLLGKITPAVRQAIETPANVNPARWTPMLGDWAEYPGRHVSTLAIASRALHEYGKLDSYLTKGITARLMEAFDGEHFGSTFETSQTLIHTGWLVRAELKRRAKAGQPKVMVGGKPVPRDKLRAQPVIAGWELLVPGEEAAKGPLTLAGIDDAWTARVKLTKEAVLDDVKEVAGGWNLRKEYYRLDEKTGGATPLEPGETVKVGDLVYVKLSFRRDKKKARWWASSYYVLSDQVPAGMAVVEEDKIYEASPFKLDLRSSRYKMRDVHSDKVRWYFAFERNWMDRAWQVGYVMRASHAGDYAAGVARMEDFYDETLFSQTPSRRIGIDPVADIQPGG